MKAAPAAGETWTMAVPRCDAGQRRADEGVRRVQEVVAPVGAAGVAEVMHGCLRGSVRYVAGGDSFEHRSIIAQAAQELHPGGEGGLDVVGQHGLVGMMAEAAGRAQEEHRGGHAARDDHGIVAGAAGHRVRLRAGRCGDGCGEQRRSDAESMGTAG